MLAGRVVGALVSEGGYQEFPLTSESTWLPVMVALLVGALLGGAAVALYQRRRRRSSVYASPRPVLVTPTGERAEPIQVDELDWNAGAPMPVLNSTDHRTVFA